MTLEIINTGAFPNDATGDPLQTAFQKCNANFATLNIPNLEIDSLLPTFNVPLGLVLDGVTDNTTIIQTALNSGVHVVTLPTGLIFMASGITIPAGVILKGMGCIPGRTGQTGPQGTVLLFGANVATCVTIGPSPTLQTAGMCDLVVTRNAMTATSGTIGILVQNATMVILRNVFSRTHGILYKYYWQSDGVHAEMQNCFGENPTNNFIVCDGWPELYVMGGRYGAIPDVAGANAFVYVTATTPGAAGPNTLVFDSTHFNGNGASGPNYWMQFDAVNTGQGNQVEYRIVNCHIESVLLGVIGSTSTAPYVDRFFMDDCVMNSNVPLFTLNAATQLNSVSIANSYHLGSITLNAINFVNRLRFENMHVQQSVTLTGIASVANNMKIMGGFIEGTLTITGTWDDCYVRCSAASFSISGLQTFHSGSAIDIDVFGQGIDCITSRTKYCVGTGSGSLGIQTFYKTSQGSLGAPMVSQNDDVPFEFLGQLYTGSAYGTCATIRTQADGNSGSGSTPGLIILATTANGSTGPTDRVLINNGGTMIINQPTAGPALKLTGTSAGTPALVANTTATTGSQTATFTATNKPGTGTTAPSNWIPILLDNVTYYIPVWQ